MLFVKVYNVCILIPSSTGWVVLVVMSWVVVEQGVRSGGGGGGDDNARGALGGRWAWLIQNFLISRTDRQTDSELKVVVKLRLLGED